MNYQANQPITANVEYLLCGFLFLMLVRLAGPSINEIFQQLQGLQ